MATTPTVGNHCVGTHEDDTPDIRLKCLKSDGETQTCATWRFFYVNCPRVNFQCSNQSGAWVAASTVCQQNLW